MNKNNTTPSSNYTTKTDRLYQIKMQKAWNGFWQGLHP